MRQEFGDKLDFPTNNPDIPSESAVECDSDRRVAIWVTQVEADALLAILLNAPDNPHIAPAIAEKLLYLVADLEREFSRPEDKSAEKCPERRRRVVRSRSRRVIELGPDAFDTIFSVR